METKPQIVARKAYFCRQSEDKPNKKTLYWFCERPENAGYWETSESATRIRDLWNAIGVQMPTQSGTTPCHDFHVEEWEGRFLIFSVEPFLYDESRPEFAAASTDEQSNS